MSHAKIHPANRHAFTLAETLVAIGAIAVISVGLATIFQSVGKTLTAGKRVSAFTQYATLVERQMRRDFERMTRQGYLVIHHQYAVNPAGAAINVYPYEGAPASLARRRRVDEIMFFASGEYTSAREPMVPGATARSGNAAIYYGHGVRWPVSFGTAYEMPEVNTVPPAYPPLMLGYAPTIGEPIEDFPNQYASAWTLLRQVTLLAPLASTETRYAPAGAFGLAATSPFFTDQDLQIALQPAASSLFRANSREFPGGTGGPVVAGGIRPLRDRRGAGVGKRGERAGGVIDVVTTDLAEIRSLSQTLNRGDKTDQLFPDEVDAPAQLTTFRQTQIADDAADPLNRPGGYNLIVELTQANIQTGSGPDADSLANIHAWMREGFPANSFGDASAGPDNGVRIRTRYELEPPNYFEAAAETNDLERTFRRADQLKLTSDVFVPRCSEFIVEWTLGQTDASGRPIWFGGADAATSLPLRLYPGNPTLVGDNTTWFRPFGYLGTAIGGAAIHTLSPYLIYDYSTLQSYTTSPAGVVEATAHFGYLDPTWPGGTPPPDGEPQTLAWPWPKLIRITMTFADPNDPEVEETFQFVFEVPADPKP